MTRTLFHSVFETTIRYVAGLLSSFEMSGSKHQILVEKAQQVADKMAFAWIDVCINAICSRFPTF